MTKNLNDKDYKHVNNNINKNNNDNTKIYEE